MIDGTALRRSRRRRHQRAFTLAELMISLAMGLIVSLAAVGLARTATTTFYEQARISGVESNVRAASERLRNDLSRASYMSTPNIRLDPKVARPAGWVAGQPYRVAALTNLQGLRIRPAATPIATHALTVKNGITPQQAFITGNLTSDDQYRGTLIGMSGSTATVVLSSAADPAVRRLFNGGAATAAAVNGVFMPGSAMVPPVLTAYAVQVMDARGCFHYLTVTNVQVTGLTTVELTLTATAATPALLTPADINGDICGARVQEEIAISPIHTVLWYLDKETDPRLINVATDGAGAPNKLNLYRQLLDVNDAAVGPPELIAEYAVDLKFGLSIDNAPLAPSQIDLDFESPPASFTTWADNPVAVPAPAGIGSHRIRSVRYRIAFRTPMADRTTDVPLAAGPPYLARYCMQGATPCAEYARVRTVISEVVLLNQAKANY